MDYDWIMGKLLSDCDAAYFSVTNADLNELSGDEINYYPMNPVSGKIDPLYGEHTERTPGGPYRIWASVSWPEINPQPGEAAFGVEFDGMVWISRLHLDKANAPYPSEGDIIEMWRTPYHDANSRGKGYFFDIIKAQNDGHVNDSPSFVQFKLVLKRRSQFNAERRLTPP